MTGLVEYAGPDAVAGPFARLTLNSPHNRNALSTTLVNQLHQGLRDAAADPAVRLVVLGHTIEEMGMRFAQLGLIAGVARVPTPLSQ